MYIYPDNLSAKATLWLWELRDIGIIGVGLLLSVLALTQTGIALPLVLTAVFAFLTIRHEDKGGYHLAANKKKATARHTEDTPVKSFLDIKG